MWSPTCPRRGSGPSASLAAAGTMDITIIIIVFHFTHAACRLWRSYIPIMGSLPIVSFGLLCFLSCSRVRSSSFVALIDGILTRPCSRPLRFQGSVVGTLWNIISLILNFWFPFLVIEPPPHPSVPYRGSLLCRRATIPTCNTAAHCCCCELGCVMQLHPVFFR